MKIKVKQGQSIFDIALIAYSDASLAYRVIAENPQIGNIMSPLTGMELTVTEVKSSNPKEALKVKQNVKKNSVVGSMQSIIDLALQYTGSAENVFDIVRNNPQLENIFSDPTGIILKYDDNTTYIPEYYRANRMTVATKPLAITSSQGSFVRTQGGFYILMENGFHILLE